MKLNFELDIRLPKLIDNRKPLDIKKILRDEDITYHKIMRRYRKFMSARRDGKKINRQKVKNCAAKVKTFVYKLQRLRNIVAKSNYEKRDKLLKYLDSHIAEAKNTSRLYREKVIEL